MDEETLRRVSQVSKELADRISTMNIIDTLEEYDSWYVALSNESGGTAFDIDIFDEDVRLRIVDEIRQYYRHRIATLKKEFHQLTRRDFTKKMTNMGAEHVA